MRNHAVFPVPEVLALALTRYLTGSFVANTRRNGAPQWCRIRSACTSAKRRRPTASAYPAGAPQAISFSHGRGAALARELAYVLHSPAFQERAHMTTIPPSAHAPVQLSIRDVRKSFPVKAGAVQVLDGLSFDIYEKISSVSSVPAAAVSRLFSTLSPACCRPTAGNEGGAGLSQVVGPVPTYAKKALALPQ
jgi:hypothetical protein